jgi:deoxyribodipyrimidine photolyase-related protein
MKVAALVYPHQLFEEHPAVARGATAYVVEDPLYFSRYKFHKQKLVLHRASMRAYADALRAEGCDVRYVEHAQAAATPLSQLLKADGVTEVRVADVVDDWLGKKIAREARHAGAALVWLPTPQFLTSDEDARAYRRTRKSLLHHAFYTWQRKRLGVLVDSGKPRGGRWSYDAENRQALPKGVALPKDYAAPRNAYVEEAIAYVEKNFGGHYGRSDAFAYAVTREDARACLQTFLRDRLDLFGAYEDAVSARGHVLFHSALSPYLNNGLLTPREVLDAALRYGERHATPIASLEGFVRQLIGWREFVRVVYVCDGARMRRQNALGANRILTGAWWDGTTGLLPVDESIKLLERYAYTHHIVRLMILGNVMTLLGVHPDEGYRWFMEWYIDAYDWVMVPNVYGMALFADGGSMVTKPYVSSSRYVLKMSDYPKGDWCGKWDALYWTFVRDHAELLSRNVRASFAVSLLARLAEGKRREHFRVADETREAITGLGERPPRNRIEG